MDTNHSFKGFGTSLKLKSISIAKISKFSYLKEMVVPKVRLTIDGLPFTTEGYERAKAIPRSKYGDESEVVNAHVQNIMMLPTITNTSSSKIKENLHSLIVQFSGRLLSSNE
jgi:hypothetical protein